jgi:hypothetical protein
LNNLVTIFSWSMWLTCHFCVANCSSKVTGINILHCADHADMMKLVMSVIHISF